MKDLESGPMTRFKIKSPAQIIKGIILVVVLVLLIEYLTTHWSEFRTLGSIRLEFFLPVTLLCCFALLLTSVRFHLFLTQVSHRIPFYTMFKYYTYGRFLNRFLPMGGSVYRAIMLKKTDGISYKKYAASNLAFDWLNMVYSTLLGVVVIAVYDPSLQIGPIPVLPSFGAILVLLLLAFLMARAVFSLLRRLALAPSIRNRLDDASDIVEAMADALKNRGVFMGSSAIITLILAGSLISYHLLFKSIGVDTDFVILLVYLIIIRFVRVFRLTPANLGVREFLLGFLTYSLGTGTADGIMVSLLMRLIAFLVQGGVSLGIFVGERAHQLIKAHRSSA